MERFFKPKPIAPFTCSGSSSSRQNECDIDFNNLERDPGKRIRMKDYPSNIQDEVRRAYLQMGPCTPTKYEFPYFANGTLLALVLPVATASVERAFSAMNIIKGPLRNKMGDQWLNDSLVVYIEKYVFSCIGNEAIMEHFQTMKPRRERLN
ncbi:uncharacterized protein [Pyrus communis]|uniref:uncharacterized protein n=1 Tax=Pyrus communis TaxID=23211 RepID=UPI0035BFDD9D